MRLLRYVAKRLLLVAPVMFGVLLVTFVVSRVLPGDPIHLMISIQDLDEASLAAARHELGLDRPLPEQFVAYAGKVLKGDLGVSYVTGNKVLDDIKQRFPATFELTTLSLVLTTLLAIPLGVLAAIGRDRALDHVARLVSLVGVAMPAFWLGLVLVYVLYFKLGWFPAPMGRLPIGMHIPRITGLFTVDALLARDLRAFGTVLTHLALPVITLSFRSMAALMRLTRSSMIEVLGSDYVRSARAQGLPSRMVSFKFALKNALLAPVTIIGQQYGQLLGGAVVVEVVFAWPGLGFWAATAAASSDFAPVQAFAMLAAALYVVVFLLVDVAYFCLDPRIRY